MPQVRHVPPKRATAVDELLLDDDEMGEDELEEFWKDHKRSGFEPIATDDGRCPHVAQGCYHRRAKHPTY